MIIDSSLAFDPAASALTVTRDSTNILDLLVARDLGVDPEMRLLIDGNGLFAASGAATCTIALQGAPDNGSGAPGTFTTYAQSIALSIAQMNAAGNLFPIMMPRPPSVALARPRFLKLVYTVATGPFTAGALQAYLVAARDEHIYYPAGYSTANI